MKRATNIVDHLREFGRKSDLKVYPVDLNEPIRDVFTLLGQQLKLRNIKVNLQLEPALPKIHGRQKSAGANLSEPDHQCQGCHGIKGAGSDQGTHDYDLPGRKKVVAAEVSDTGIGVPEDIQKKIFDPFFTTKEAGKGTGLGLSITYNLVKDFRGDIDVESAPGAGTTFTVKFPIHQERGYSGDEVINH